MSDHDLRRQAREIREALSRYDRDQLINILGHVFAHYVMQGSEPVSLPQRGPAAGAAAGALGDELVGLSFARLMERLQLRLDLPELQFFEVQDGKVSVRVGGRLHPLDAPTPAREPLPTPARVTSSPVSDPAPAPSANPAPGVYAVSRGPGPGAQPSQAGPSPGAPGTSASASSPASAPGPASASGLSSSSSAGAVPPMGYAGAQRPETTAGRSIATATAAPSGGPAAQRGAPARPAAVPSPPAPAQPAREERPTEEGGGRFSMLEID